MNCINASAETGMILKSDSVQHNDDCILQLFSSYLPSGFDSFKDAEVDEDPGQQQQEEELPPQGARLLHTTGPLQHLITKRADTSTAVNTTNFTNKPIT